MIDDSAALKMHKEDNFYRNGAIAIAVLSTVWLASMVSFLIVILQKQ